MTVIELPDEQAAVLKAKAAAEGLSLEAWLSEISFQSPACDQEGGLINLARPEFERQNRFYFEDREPGNETM
ncbi:MAG TPA: hypothetical protein VMT20_22545 [Terriglobia bacterium]|nr:hypothetical protein [Terriglobia bacterium]